MLYIDFETASECDIKTAGGLEYARHPSTWVICMAFALDDQPVQVYVPKQELTRAMLQAPPEYVVTELPVDVVKHIENNGLITAHNAEFDYHVWHNADYAPDIKPILKQMRCSQAQGCAMALPASLDKMTSALHTEHRKNPKGTRLITKMCCPPTFETSPVLLEEMMDYCKSDVEAMRSMPLMKLTDTEQRVWEVNAIVNERGVPIDQQLASECIYHAAEADKKLIELSGLPSATAMRSPKQMREKCIELGQDIESFSKASLACTEITVPEVQELLDIRAQVCKSAMAKFPTMLAASETDGRARGNHVYHKATTGRFAGSGIQIQNLARPTINNPEEVAEEFLANNKLNVPLMEQKDTLSSLLRACIKTDKEFLCADFSAIEVRVIFWLAGEAKGLDLYRQGADIYCATASAVFGYPCNKKDHPKERQIGKGLVLGANFGLGAVGFAGNCEAMGVDLTGLDPKELVSTYRKTYAPVQQFWYACEKAAMDAIEHPGQAFKVGFLAFKYSPRWKSLGCLLPSGRIIMWREPEIKEALMPWGDIKDQIHYKGMISTINKWGVKTTHGADIAQSATQAVARDLLVHGLVALEDAGWHPVLHVHDEIMCEENKGERRLDDMIDIMNKLPKWANGLPVASEGWIGQRYQK